MAGDSGTLTCCFGGTSIAAAIWSGFGTIVAQRWGSRVGSFFNTRVYEMGPQGIGSGVRDVVSGTNTFNGVSGFGAGPGYDQATGWGTTDISKFIINFAAERVLITGGGTPTTTFAEAEIYNFSTGTFSKTGSMSSQRFYHNQTLLDDGTTLVTGGYNGSQTVLKTAEIYDPATAHFSSTGSMNVARAQHSATLLADGTVLIVGGITSGLKVTNTAEIYDPATRTFTLTTGSLQTARSLQNANLLASGEVLIAAGAGQSVNGLATAELYNPSTKSFSATGSLNQARGEGTSTVLVNGQVLFAGGDSATGTVCNDHQTLSSAEIYDPTTGVFSVTGSMLYGVSQDTATLLNNGKVLVAGGGNDDFCRQIWTIAQLYDPTTSSFSLTGPANNDHDFGTSSLLPNGKVLVAGAVNTNTINSRRAETYDPSSGSFAPTGNLIQGRAWAGVGATQ